MKTMRIFIFQTCSSLLFACCFLFSTAQPFPKNGTILNFTQLMYQAEEVAGGKLYEFSVFDPAISTTKAIWSVKKQSIAALCPVNLEFGKKYCWSYRAFSDKKQLYQSPQFYFSTSVSPRADSNLYRFKVTVGKQPGTECIFLDGAGVAINRQGRVIWQMDDYDGQQQRHLAFRNIHLGPGGTILYLEQSRFIEKTLNGELLWQAPKLAVRSQDSVENYHHDGTKMNDGSYIVCSYRIEPGPCPSAMDQQCKFQYGTLLQFDKSGTLMWWWNEKDMISRSDYLSKASENESAFAGTHLNGFDLDPVSQNFILSFRDNNRLLNFNKNNYRINYDIRPGTIAGLNFSGQHSPAFINPNQFVFYNNNLSRGKESTVPKNAWVYILQEETGHALPKKIWEYECASDSFPQGTTGKEGYAMPLPNGNVLVCTGGTNWLFEITRQKKIVWECFMSSFNKSTSQWNNFSNYRARRYSSLYPRFFTIQYQFSNGAVKINNDGTDPGIYELTGFDAKDNQYTIKRDIRIKPGTSLLVQLKDVRPGITRFAVRIQGVAGTEHYFATSGSKQ